MHTREALLETRGQTTRESILSAAKRVFLRKGYHRATVDDITKSAKVAHGTFYRYFRNKQDVLNFLVGQAISKIQLPERDWAQADMLAAIRDDVAAYFANIAEHRDLARIWAEAASYDEAIAEARRTLRRPFIARIKDSIASGVELGLIPPVDVEVAGHALGAMVDSFAHEWLVIDNRGGDLQHMAEVVAIIWYRGLGYR